LVFTAASNGIVSTVTERGNGIHQHDNAAYDIDVIVGRDDREIDITWELKEFFHIARMHHPGDSPYPVDARTLHRFGWGLISVAGIDTAIELNRVQFETHRFRVRSSPSERLWKAGTYGFPTGRGLVDDREDDEESNPTFAGFLRAKWRAIAARME
jgi:hypothetical protein